MNHQFKHNKYDEYYTPEYAVKPILEFIPTNTTVWCPFDTANSNYIKLLEQRGNKVVYSHIDDGKDFFDYEPSYYDVIISNPPYSKREAILERLYKLNKPFGILINEAGLFDSKKRYKLLRDNKFEIMVFDGRIDYERANITTLSSPPFKSIYLCSNLLPDKFVFRSLDNKKTSLGDREQTPDTKIENHSNLFTKETNGK